MYDLLVLGDDPAGLATAKQASRRGLSVGLICPPVDALRSGMFLSESLRGMVPGLATDILRDRSNFGPRLSISELRQLIIPRVECFANMLFDRFRGIGTDVRQGHARFLDERTIEVGGTNVAQVLRAKNFVIATGAEYGTNTRTPELQQLVLNTDEILCAEPMPGRLVIVGADATAIEFAGLFAVAGSRVTIVDGATGLREFDDGDVDTLIDVAMALGVSFRLGAGVIGMEHSDAGSVGTVNVHLDNGSHINSDRVLVTSRRIGRTNGMDLQSAGLVTDDCHRLWCDHNLRTWQPHIFGVGDVVGFTPQNLAPMAQAEIVMQSLAAASRIPAPLGLKRPRTSSPLRVL